jgi:hypothetical protein
MTSDAKIGLLLGLVFIFVIAFVINGLPSLRPPTTSNAEVTTIAGEDFEAGVAGPAATVPNLNELLDQPRAAAEPPQPAVAQTPQPSGPLAAGPQVSPTSTVGEEGIRFSTALSGIARMLDQLPVIVPANRGDTFSMDTPKPASEPPAVSERQPVASVLQPRVEMPSGSKPAELLTKAADTVESAKPAPAAIPGSKTYVVTAGDTLPAIRGFMVPRKATGWPTSTGSTRPISRC